jgi:hypothetical protein
MIEARPIGIKRRSVQFATLLAGLVGASTALIGGGEVWATIELLWVVGAFALSYPRPRDALRLMWWGALVLFLVGLLIVAVLGLGRMIPFDCGTGCQEREAAESRGWGPYLLTTIVMWIGATIVWVANRAKGSTTPTPDAVPPARIAR